MSHGALWTPHLLHELGTVVATQQNRLGLKLVRRGQQAELGVGLAGCGLLVTTTSQVNSSVPGVPATTNQTS